MDNSGANELIQQGEAFYNLERPQQALEAFQAALALQPSHPYAIAGIALAYYKQEKFDQASPFVEQVLKLDPNNAWAHTALGSLLFNRQQNDQAILEYQKALELTPDLRWPLVNLGHVYARQKQSDNASRQYQAAIERYPEWATPYYWLGRLLDDQGDQNGAIEKYKQAAALNPSWRWPPYSLGSIYYSDLGQPDLALIEFQKALELDPAMSWAHGMIGMIYEQQKNKKKALQAYHLALKLAGEKDKDWQRQMAWRISMAQLMPWKSWILGALIWVQPLIAMLFWVPFLFADIFSLSGPFRLLALAGWGWGFSYTFGVAIVGWAATGFLSQKTLYGKNNSLPRGIIGYILLLAGWGASSFIAVNWLAAFDELSLLGSLPEDILVLPQLLIALTMLMTALRIEREENGLIYNLAQGVAVGLMFGAIVLSRVWGQLHATFTVLLPNLGDLEFYLLYVVAYLVLFSMASRLATFISNYYCDIVAKRYRAIETP